MGARARWVAPGHSARLRGTAPHGGKAGLRSRLCTAGEHWLAPHRPQRWRSSRRSDSRVQPRRVVTTAPGVGGSVCTVGGTEALRTSLRYRTARQQGWPPLYWALYQENTTISLHPTTSHYIPPHPIPSHPIPSNPIPSHPVLSHTPHHTPPNHNTPHYTTPHHNTK